MKIPLGLVNSGGKAIIRDIRGGKHVQQQLLEQGFVSGSCLHVLQNNVGSPLIVALDSTRLALGHGLALQISVEECA
jgi:ferrous iron transport protein A